MNCKPPASAQQAQRALCDHHCSPDLFFMSTGAHLNPCLFMLRLPQFFFHGLYSATIRLAINVNIYHKLELHFNSLCPSQLSSPFVHLP